MKTFRNRDGFTLVEMLIVILVGSIVTLATVTVLLLGVRMQKKATDTVQQQNASRIILSSLNQLAAENAIGKLISGTDSWYVCSTKNAPTEENPQVDDKVLLAYDSASGSISSGGTVTTSMSGGESIYSYAGGETVLDGVYASHAVLKGNLLTFAVETEEGAYTSSTYCRIAPDNVQDAVIEDLENGEDNVIEDALKPEAQLSTTAARKAFLKKVTSQRGSPGLILEKLTDVNGKVHYLSAGEYYSQWHIGDGWGNNGWDKETPWCACFVTWALDVPTQGTEKNTVDGKEVTYKSELLRTPVLGRNINGLANVDKFIAYLDGQYTSAVEKKLKLNEGTLQFWFPCELIGKPMKDGTIEIASQVKIPDASEKDLGRIPQIKEGADGEKIFTPLPGDLIFFDWIIDANDDSDHVGVVLTVNNGYVYTVEGNSADMVAVRRYKEDDPRIMGYGVLDWKLGEQLEETEPTQPE